MIRLLDRMAKESGDEEVRLTEELRTLTVAARSKAQRKENLAAYASYSNQLGRLYLLSPDPSDALRPFGCAYMTACVAGMPLIDARITASEGLSGSTHTPAITSLRRSALPR
jgi:hypothetical protein